MTHKHTIDKEPIFKDFFKSHQTCNPKNIYIIGHSLGGAMAFVFAGLLANHAETKIIENTYIKTYGSPRPGDKSFAKAID